MAAAAAAVEAVFARLAAAVARAGERGTEFGKHFLGQNAAGVVVDDEQHLPPSRCRINRLRRTVRHALLEEESSQAGEAPAAAPAATQALPPALPLAGIEVLERPRSFSRSASHVDLAAALEPQTRQQWVGAPVAVQVLEPHGPRGPSAAPPSLLAPPQWPMHQ